MHWLRDGRNAARLTRDDAITSETFIQVAGNHVVIQIAELLFVALVHMRKNSVRVKTGDKVRCGDILGEIGHSGNSMIPHLHLQVMDHLDLAAAKGLPFVFREYEVFREGSWQKVVNSLPKSHDHIRSVS